MKIDYKQPVNTANISSARGTAGKELWQLVLSAAALLVALYLIIGLVVDGIVLRISFDTEAKLFKSYQIPVQEVEVLAYQPYVKRAEAILAKLKSRPAAPALPYRLVLVDSEQPNAFAFPGGSIAVTKGLMDVLTEDIGVAFVLGHEIGHYAHRDHLQGMGRAIGLRIIMALLSNRGSGAESFGEMVDFIFQRSYSQDRESKADRFGLKLVHDTFGQVDGVDRLFQLLLEGRDLPEWAYMFASHPSPDKRITDLKAYAEILVKSDH